MTTFHATNPRTGEPLGHYTDATQDDVRAACAAAAGAFDVRVDRKGIASMLEKIAGNIEASDDLIALADQETALGAERLTGERARTCGQLRAFADLVDHRSHLEPIVDPAAEGHPDIRRMMVPVGPVAVFGASNFPLAFSVPGGDTASALAAGCPVVAKGHPSHPGTSQLCADLIASAVTETGRPPGTFAMVQGADPDVGRELVLAPQIRAVGFTGSHQAGRALFELAATRPHPIPVFAEMGSLNPFFVTQAAIEARGTDIATSLAGSITLGHGQFCTKPGLVLIPDTHAAQGFVEDVTTQVLGVGSHPMLNESIATAYEHIVQRTAEMENVHQEKHQTDTKALWSNPALFVTDIDTFIREEELLTEHFGPAAIVVRCPENRFSDAARHIDGSLTATVHGQPGPDDRLIEGLLPVLVERAGRIVFDGVPTGVAVVPAMVHGGPYPATTFPAHTSVGITAIRRWLRPVAFQNAPRDWLPDELRGET